MFELESVMELLNRLSIKKYDHVSSNARGISQGCRYCMRGQMMVLSISLRCPRRCYYCPIPNGLKDWDVVFANDVELKKKYDFDTVAMVAETMGAKGCGITGGDPLVSLSRTIKYIRFFRDRYGPDFYIHLYTWGTHATEAVVKKLEDAGLNEIRFHLWPKGGFERIRPALNSGLRVGVEVPAEPRRWAQLKAILNFARGEKRLQFINLNELEYHPQTTAKFHRMGYDVPAGKSGTVTGSLSCAKRLMGMAGKGKTVHVCAAHSKHNFQTVNRGRRLAFAVKRTYEVVDEDGYLLKSVLLLGKKDDKMRLLLSKEKRVFQDEISGNWECSIKHSNFIEKRYGIKSEIVAVNPGYELKSRYKF